MRRGGAIEAEGLSDRFQQLALGRVFRLVARQLGAGIVQRRCDHLALFSALGNGDLDLVSGPHRKGFGEQRALGHSFAQQDECGRWARIVELAEKRPEHLAGRHVLGVAREIGPVAPILPGAKEEYLHAGFAGLLMHREDIGVGKARRIDALARMDLAHGPDAVAQMRRPLEIHRLRRVVHLPRQCLLHCAALAGEKVLGLATSAA